MIARSCWKWRLRATFAVALLTTTCFLVSAANAAAEPDKFRIATFSADVTIPLGHRCMGILPTKSQAIDDPLEARGVVLLGGERPIVLAAIDWCELRNGAYDQWRDALAAAAGTTRERVLVSCLHQHDAPVCDSGAQQLLDEVGLPEELYDREFHAQCLSRVSQAIKEGLDDAVPVTHIGLGRAKVEQVASSRRVVGSDGKPGFNRYSRSANNKFLSEAPDGLIDPWLRTISFWNEASPIAALHSYATHPMSHYGAGKVSADFVGLARRLQQRDKPDLFQIYVTGCSGDVTAGKYNDGSAAMRGVLADRVHRAMSAAWQATKRTPLTQMDFRCGKLDLPWHESDKLGRQAMRRTLDNRQAKMGDRILAAMGLSSLDRLESRQAIDLPVVDFGPVQLVLFPGEAFVGYQLMASEMRPDSFVMSIGYGECWTGYIPTNMAFAEGFGHGWRWVGPGSEDRIVKELRKVLPAK